ncbi:hypothetical protein [Oceanobacillus alkalisoli]|uniref:hypothetical protein n=1 Tax=Oceanobacillus alkalisoli TaxID=2925113 RepID=UPI001F11EEB7|nr:hypothetical protein [Oceanobacillus alkalisoli]MCF3942230.1 hypothetical protein [Oceanobacillus alkalisoli]
MKLLLTWASLFIIWKSTMDTADPTNLFSNLAVFYAMYWLSYHENSSGLKPAFLKVIQTIVGIVGLICLAGWINMLTIREVEGQFFISLSASMRMGNYDIINVNIFFIVIAIKLAFIAGFEWIVGMKDKRVGKTYDVKEKKGA